MIGPPGIVRTACQLSPTVGSLPTEIDSTSSGSSASSLGFLPLHKSPMERTPTKSGSNTKTQNNQPNRQTSAIQGQRALPSPVSFQAAARSSRVVCMAPTPSSAHICYGLPDCSPLPVQQNSIDALVPIQVATFSSVAVKGFAFPSGRGFWRRKRSNFGRAAADARTTRAVEQSAFSISVHMRLL